MAQRMYKVPRREVEEGACWAVVSCAMCREGKNDQVVYQPMKEQEPRNKRYTRETVSRLNEISNQNCFLTSRSAVMAALGPMEAVVGSNPYMAKSTPVRLNTCDPNLRVQSCCSDDVCFETSSKCLT
jgi:hypothetical protein